MQKQRKLLIINIKQNSTKQNNISNLIKAPKKKKQLNKSTLKKKNEKEVPSSLPNFQSEFSY